MTIKSKKTNSSYFQGFIYRVIKFKYFIMILIALLIEVIAVSVFLLNSENILEFELFNATVLLGATSVVIVVLAIGILVLLRVDKTRDRNKVKLLLDFKKNYQKINDKYIKDISKFTQDFDNEKNSIEAKIDFAKVLENLYDAFLNELSRLKIHVLLNKAYNYESRHLAKEKQFYNRFSILVDTEELKGYNIESDVDHSDYLKEIDKLEKSLI